MVTRLHNELRVFGPPGTGKTTTLTRMITETCQTHGSDSVIVASLTKTAAKELCNRRLPIDPQRVGTLHSLCFRSLGRPKLATGKVLEDFNRAYPVHAVSDDALDTDDPYDLKPGELPGDVARQAYHLHRAKLHHRDLWPTRVLMWADKWEAWKAQTGLWDFTDLIERAYLDTDSPPFSAHVLYLDEVQDFDPLELALVRKWGRHMEELVLAGDDDQALYAWRGAIPDGFLKPDLPPEQKLILNQSYRIPKAVHFAAMAWVHQISYREPKAYHARPAPGLMEEWPRATWTHPVYLLKLIDDTLKAGKTIAILGACGYLLDPTIRMLRDHGYTFHNPYRPQKYFWNPLGARRGVTGAERILAFLRKDKNIWIDPRMWTYQEFHTWASVLDSKKLMSHKAKSQIREAAEDEKQAGELVTYEDLDRWFIDPSVPEALASRDLQWFERHVIESAAKGFAYPLKVARTHGAARLKEQPKILVGTIHSVKGGEADVVVLFPDVSPQGWKAWASPGELRDSVLRQFYVGMTRAKESLYWTVAATPCAVRGWE